MRVLALDISTSAGWALLAGGDYKDQKPVIIQTGLVKNDKTIAEFGSYPLNYLNAAYEIAFGLSEVVKATDPEVIVIEETNMGRNRYTQKVLEFTHCAFLKLYNSRHFSREIVYINTSDWRKILGIQLTKQDKKNNASVRKLKKNGDKEALKALGLRGKVGKKHLAIRYVNETFGLNLKVKDDDVADAVCLGVAYLKGAPHCDGK